MRAFKTMLLAGLCAACFASGVATGQPVISPGKIAAPSKVPTPAKTLPILWTTTGVSVSKTPAATTGSWTASTTGRRRDVTFDLRGKVGVATVDDYFGKGIVLSRFSYIGPGKAGGSVHFDDVRLADTGAAARARLSAQGLSIPADVARSIGDLDARGELNDLLDASGRWIEIGTAFGALGRGGEKNFGFGTTLTPPGKDANWSDPRGVIPSDGRASDETTTTTEINNKDDKTGTETTVTAMTITSDNGGKASAVTVSTTDDTGTTTSSTILSGGSMVSTEQRTDFPSGGSESTTTYTDTRTGTVVIHYQDDDGHGNVTHQWKVGTSGGVFGGWSSTPSETGAGKGHEEELAAFAPWLVTAQYQAWARRTDALLHRSTTSQPGAGPSTGRDTSAPPRVTGTTTVINCGDTNSVACRAATRVTPNDPRKTFGTISQPGVGPDGQPVPPKPPGTP